MIPDQTGQRCRCRRPVLLDASQQRLVDPPHCLQCLRHRLTESHAGHRLRRRRIIEARHPRVGTICLFRVHLP